MLIFETFEKAAVAWSKELHVYVIIVIISVHNNMGKWSSMNYSISLCISSIVNYQNSIKCQNREWKHSLVHLKQYLGNYVFLFMTTYMNAVPYIWE